MNKKMNLYKQYQKESVKHYKIGVGGLLVIMSFVVASLLGVYGLTLSFEISTLNRDVNAVYSYLNNSTNLEIYNTTKDKIDRNQNLRTLRDSVEEIYTIFDYKQSINNQILFEIDAAAPNDLTINSLNITGSQVSLQFTSTNQASLSQFIANLRTKEIILSVTYNGFTRSESDTQLTFSGTATATLRGSF